MFWRELSEFYPDAKVILSVRDPQAWYESMRSTVVPMMVDPSPLPDPRARDVLSTARRLVLEGFFNGEFADAAATIARFRDHEAAVRATIAPARLLIYQVSQGWEPLCSFLGVPIPSVAFPRTNDRDAFRVRAGLL
jgi:hypothetical protein